MAENKDATSAQIANYSRETYDEYLAEYEDIHGEPVHEDDEKAVFADAKGHELNDWADEIDTDRSEVAEWMHDRADDVEYNWVSSDPVVLLKDSTECIHCGAVDEPEADIHVRVEQNEHGEHYTVCNVCEPDE